MKIISVLFFKINIKIVSILAMSQMCFGLDSLAQRKCYCSQSVWILALVQKGTSDS